METTDRQIHPNGLRTELTIAHSVTSTHTWDVRAPPTT